MKRWSPPSPPQSELSGRSASRGLLGRTDALVFDQDLEWGAIRCAPSLPVSGARRTMSSKPGPGAST